MTESDKPIEAVPAEDVEVISDKDIDKPQKDIPIETLVSLRNKGLSFEQIARITGCCKQNVHQRLESIGYSKERLENFKESRADVFAFMQSKLLNSIDNAAIQKMQPYQRIIGTGILYDKERLERGQSTGIIDITTTIRSIEDLSAREKILEAQFRELTEKKKSKAK